MSRLTPEARDRMLERYVAGEAPGKLAREYEISASHFHHLRERAGIPSHRHPGGPPPRETAGYEVAAEFSPLLPVFNVRLVSRPALPRLDVSCSRGCPPGGPCAYWPEPCPAAEGGDDGRS